MEERFFVKELPNGLTLLAEPMDNVSSAAMALVLPAGAACDPPEAAGAASITAEWCMRGAGDRDSRQLNDALDDLGCQHEESVRGEELTLTSVQLGRNLPKVLEIYADVLRRPRLADETFAPSRQLVAQDLAALEDEPARKCMMLVRETFYPFPLGRCPYGTAETLQAATAETIREHAGRSFGPSGAIFAFAGNVDPEELDRLVERHFGDWAGEPVAAPRPTPQPAGVTHVEKDSAQSQIALAYPSVTIRDERYYPARLAATVLSGGMSSRLFTEVREKRGLVYHVSAKYGSLIDHAGVFVYAGTRPELAQQTLDVTVGELRRLAEDIEPAEIDRARTQLKSALVMQNESTSARAAQLAGDWRHLHRLRPLEEISDAIDATTREQVLDYAAAYPPEPMTVLTIGPKTLDIPSFAE